MTYYEWVAALPETKMQGVLNLKDVCRYGPEATREIWDAALSTNHYDALRETLFKLTFQLCTTGTADVETVNAALAIVRNLQAATVRTQVMQTQIGAER